MKGAMQIRRKGRALTCWVSNAGGGKGATHTSSHDSGQSKQYTRNTTPTHIQAADEQSNVLEPGKEIFLKTLFETYIIDTCVCHKESIGEKHPTYLEDEFSLKRLTL